MHTPVRPTDRRRPGHRGTTVAATAAVLLVLGGCGSMMDRMGMRMGGPHAGAMTHSSAMMSTMAAGVSPDDPLCAGMRLAAGEGRPPASSPMIVAGEYHLTPGAVALSMPLDMGRDDPVRVAGGGRVDRDSDDAARAPSPSSGATGAGAGAAGSMPGAVGRGSDAVSRPETGRTDRDTPSAVGASPVAGLPLMAGLHGPNSQPLARDQPTAEMRCGVDRSEVYVNP